jgi:hypothetical protein
MSALPGFMKQPFIQAAEKPSAAHELLPIMQGQVFMENNLTLNARNRAEENARHLLWSVLPDDVWQDLTKKGVIVYEGERNLYILSTASQTEIRDKTSRRLVARACLQLSVPAPQSDRVLVEYLILRNDEGLYWKTANIFSQDGWDIVIPLLFLIDLVLLINLLADLVRT